LRESASISSSKPTFGLDPMRIVSHSLFSEHYKPAPDGDGSANAVQADNVQVRMSRNLDGDLSAWREKGLKPIGEAEFVAKGDHGVAEEARAQAARVGANLVLFSIWPTKLRAVKHKPDGSIDIAGVLSDPAASLSPKGYFVMKAIFLRGQLGK